MPEKAPYLPYNPKGTIVITKRTRKNNLTGGVATLGSSRHVPTHNFYKILLKMNTTLFWFASDKIHFSVFQCNELINYICTAVWMAFIIAVYEDKSN